MRDRIAANAVSFGLFGKVPARGDFVRAGLPGSFVVPWDDWLQTVLAGSRVLLGAKWQPAWLEAPVWQFALAPGICGAGGVLGLLLPSVDSVGRYFPLTLAAVWPDRARPPGPDSGTEWLDTCEAAGCAALARDASPEQVLEGMPPPPSVVMDGVATGGLWWTAGAPRVAATRFSSAHLPADSAFAAMLDQNTAA